MVTKESTQAGSTVLCPACGKVPLSLQDSEGSPCLLQCGHTMCRQCLPQSFQTVVVEEDPQSKTPDPVECPVDGCSQESFWGNARQSIDNPAWKQLLERMETHFPSKVLCADCQLKPATVYCENDACDFCSDCNERNHQGRIQALHTRVSLEEKARMLHKCASHPAHYASYFCFQCRAFICSDFCLHGDHAGHEAILVPIAATRMKNTFGESSTSMKSRRLLFQDCSRDDAQALKNLEIAYKKCSEAALHQRNIFIAAASQRCDALVAEATTLYNRKKDALMQQRAELAAMSASIDAVVYEGQRLMGAGDVILLGAGIDTRADQMRAQAENLSVSPAADAGIFIIFEGAAELETAIKRFGSIRPIPPAPQNVQPVLSEGLPVRITWDGVPKTSSYRIEVKRGDTMIDDIIETLTYCELTCLTIGVEYTVSVSANVHNVAGEKATVKFTVPGPVQRPPPSVTAEHVLQHDTPDPSHEGPAMKPMEEKPVEVKPVEPKSNEGRQHVPEPKTHEASVHPRQPVINAESKHQKPVEHQRPAVEHQRPAVEHQRPAIDPPHIHHHALRDNVFSPVEFSTSLCSATAVIDPPLTLKGTHNMKCSTVLAVNSIVIAENSGQCGYFEARVVSWNKFAHASIGFAAADFPFDTKILGRHGVSLRWQANEVADSTITDLSTAKVPSLKLPKYNTGDVIGIRIDCTGLPSLCFYVNCVVQLEVLLPKDLFGKEIHPAFAAFNAVIEAVAEPVCPPQ